MRVHFQVEPGTHDIFSKIPFGVSLFESFVHDIAQFPELATHIDVGRIDLAGIGAQDHAFDQQVRVFHQEFSILTRTRFAFVGVARQVTRKHILGQERPLETGREPSTTASAQPGSLHHFHNFVRLFGERLFQRLVPIQRFFIHVQRREVGGVYIFHQYQHKDYL